MLQIFTRSKNMYWCSVLLTEQARCSRNDLMMKLYISFLKKLKGKS